MRHSGGGGRSWIWPLALEALWKKEKGEENPLNIYSRVPQPSVLNDEFKEVSTPGDLVEAVAYAGRKTGWQNALARCCVSCGPHWRAPAYHC